METAKRDIRLYEYDGGILRKLGFGKTHQIPHMHTSLESCQATVEILMQRKIYRKKDRQKSVPTDQVHQVDLQIVDLLPAFRMLQWPPDRRDYRKRAPA